MVWFALVYFGLVWFLMLQFVREVLVSIHTKFELSMCLVYCHTQAKLKLKAKLVWLDNQLISHTTTTAVLFEPSALKSDQGLSSQLIMSYLEFGTPAKR